MEKTDMFHFIRYHHHLAQHTPFFRKFFFLTWIYVFVCLITTAVAVNANMKAEFNHWHTNLTVLNDFIYGIGTALSPPLIVLLAYVILIDFTFKHTITARVSLLLIVLLSIENTLMAVSQPMGTLINFGLVYSALHVLVIILPLIIAWMAADVFITRLKTVMPD